MSGPRGQKETPPFKLHDVSGLELNVGDLVLMTRKLEDGWTAIIVDMKPRLDPRSKQHEIQVTLTATFPIVAPRNGRVPRMWLYQTAEQTGWKPESERGPDHDKDEVVGEGSSIIIP